MDALVGLMNEESFIEEKGSFTEGVKAFRNSEMPTDKQKMTVLKEIKTGSTAVVSIAKKFSEMLEADKWKTQSKLYLETCLGAIIHLIVNEEQALLCIRHTSFIATIRD